MENIVTILTPTYNRSNLLQKLYNSLLSQTNKKFEWVVVDDGSTDETEMIVNKFIKENLIKIQYIKKDNGGKHTAINTGIKKITSQYTFIVDSDDWLKENAIETILTYHDLYKNRHDIVGFAFLRCYPSGEINTSLNNKDDFVGNYVDDRIRKRIVGDMAEVYKTTCLKENLFPQFASEKFIGEDVVWIEIAKEGNLVFSSKCIYISDYLKDGLTQNRRKNMVQSPKGWYFLSKKYLTINGLPFKTRIKFSLFLLIFGKFANYKVSKLIGDIGFFRFIIYYPPSLFLYIMWRKYR